MFRQKGRNFSGGSYMKLVLHPHCEVKLYVCGYFLRYLLAYNGIRWDLTSNFFGNKIFFKNMSRMVGFLNLLFFNV